MKPTGLSDPQAVAIRDSSLTNKILSVIIVTKKKICVKNCWNQTKEVEENVNFTVE